MIRAVDLALFQSANALVDRSFTLDALMALALDRVVLKGGPIAACFLFAWWHGTPGQRQSSNRKTLLLTLCALFVVAPVMKLVSTTMPLSPRPLVTAENVYVLDHGAMVARGMTDYRVPATGLAADLSQKAAEGTIAGNDLASFPSDHAALFAAFAGGILLAMRAAGLAASIWAIIGVFLPRVVTGLHWPSDMIAGALAGLVVLALVLTAGRRLFDRPLTWLLTLAERHPAWSQAIILLALFEAAGAMSTLSRIAELAKGAIGL
ncbi:MAG: phosphatase PAP2 family protein [Erythrobacter sp.]|jgi:undecaprenyl-diphosphatase|uniref:phosphatase PAP2 family protein n=1 Tax=Erythrobacter sp. TaxID=1042 RepID=UPI002B492D78|nr:phosphatase PAP2 family protein [Erythrobacter sp.]WRH70176.1 MAG: phosphatase PAP2 family protein [Erythrobacter sp.]